MGHLLLCFNEITLLDASEQCSLQVNLYLIAGRLRCCGLTYIGYCFFNCIYQSKSKELVPSSLRWYSPTHQPAVQFGLANNYTKTNKNDYNWKLMVTCNGVGSGAKCFYQRNVMLYWSRYHLHYQSSNHRERFPFVWQNRRELPPNGKVHWTKE